MSLEFQAAAARRMRRLVTGLVVLVLVLVATVLVLALRSGDRSTPPAATSPLPARDGTTSASSPAAVSPFSPTATFTPDSSFVAPVRWVRLPPSTGTRLGLPTGFPHTPQGAVAAAVAAAQYGTTWDLDETDRVVRAYAVPAELDRHLAGSQREVSGSRQSLGLPATGPLPAGAAISGAPIGVVWTVLGPDLVQVVVLGRQTYTTPGSGQKTLLSSGQQRMVWTDGDWRTAVFTPDQTVKTPDPVDLGSAAFNDAGWTAIQQGSSG
jgi:hypothetical protein